MSAVSDFLESATDKVGGFIDQNAGKIATAAGGFFGGPIGAAAGSAFGSLSKGGDLGDAAGSGALTYAGGQFLGGGDGAAAADSAQFGIPVGGINPTTGAQVGDWSGVNIGGSGAPIPAGGGGGAPGFDVGATGGEGFAGPAGFDVGATGGPGTVSPTGGAPDVPGGGAGVPLGGSPDGSGLGDAGEEARRRAAAARPAAAPAAGAPGGNVMQKLLDGFKKNPLPYAAGAANLIAQMRASKSAGSTSNQLKALGQPAADASASLMEQYKSGKLNVGTQFDIDKWKNQQIAAARNFYAKAGMGSSSTARNAIAQIEAQAAAMADRAREGLLTQGLNAAGIAQGPLSMAIQQQAKDDTALSDAAAKALNALMVVQTMGGKAAGGVPANP